MDTLSQAFDERLAEIDTYLDLLRAFEVEIQQGPPKIGNDKVAITAKQQRILYSSVYLQLYNLVEATVAKCFAAVTNAVAQDGWRPADLSHELQREWVRQMVQTHKDLSYEVRLDRSMKLCDHLIRTRPVEQMAIDRGGGGNWDDEEIYRAASRIGCSLQISPAGNQSAKRPFKNDMGALALIMRLRNELAHGDVSFAECGSDVTVSELLELRNRTVGYLTEVVASFALFVDSYSFLIPERRPLESA